MDVCVLADTQLDALTELGSEVLLASLTFWQYQPNQSLPDWPAESRVWLYLKDEQIRQLLLEFARRKWQIAILPHADAPQARLAFGYSSQWQDCMQQAQHAPPQPVDLLLCNGMPVLRQVIVGDTFGFRPGGAVYRISERLGRFWEALKRLPKLKPQVYKLETQQGDRVETAAIGISVVEHGNHSVIGHQLLQDSALNDGRCHAIILAPRSLMEMFRLLVQSLFMRRHVHLPSCVGLVASTSLKIDTNQGVHYQHDGIALCSRQLEIECQHLGLTIIPGPLLSLKPIHMAPKESKRLQHIPTGSAVNEVALQPLRWIAHAATDEFRELYLSLREQAKPSSSFLNLMLLATALASLGLFANSPPVIIGAMILAPLMAPIISLAMALARQDEPLLKQASRTLFSGLGLAIGCGALLSFLIPITQITSEISARTQPNLLDLGVAVLSGIAGAYAHAKVSVAKSLAGVAIAVALVPPLAVTGIGVGWLNWPLIWGAGLLFLTNLAGILLAGTMTFWALGFAPFQRAQRGVLVSSMAVILISFPLAASFQSMLENERLLKSVQQLAFDSLELTQVEIKETKPLTISIALVAEKPITYQTQQAIKRQLETSLEQPVILETRQILRLR